MRNPANNFLHTIRCSSINSRFHPLQCGDESKNESRTTNPFDVSSMDRSDLRTGAKHAQRKNQFVHHVNRCKKGEYASTHYSCFVLNSREKSDSRITNHVQRIVWSQLKTQYTSKNTAVLLRLPGRTRRGAASPYAELGRAPLRHLLPKYRID